MSIQLTTAAADRVRHFMSQAAAKGEPGIGLRFGVKRTGCSGWQHFADLATDSAADDHRFESLGVTVLVDAESLPIVDGTEIDVIRAKLGDQFVFRNPQALEACGCGESFTTTVVPDLPVHSLPSL
ncbi:iron-sulfur cluster assembly accessory protein [Luteimonas sp. FXH3W]|jgi:iron-sulfur cluster assembly protein|uniref:Iron-sulfur cluster assembly accessory protein n=1 Tax=Aquilutibacter rugosus TaxID=3115820 RepID=A0ABU7V030_9GAMM